MIVVHKIDELRNILSKERKENKTIGFVPTMGALHEGHLSLIEKSVSENNFTVVSIFVNPIQFGPNEDYEKYPRTLLEDTVLCKKGKADLIFAPDKNEMFGVKNYAFVDINELQDNLCGFSRPGHFRGVCTIVAKFFNIVSPDRAYFGKKDIQQFLIIKKMVEDLNFSISIVGCPIIRDSEGLALSSRNKYLSSEERKEALALNKSIKSAIKLIESGEKNAKNVIDNVISEIKKVKIAKIDYVKIVDENMKDVSLVKNGNILALAVFFGKTRLIDNHILGEEICY